jgi:phage major head subunit gpT-like protein
MPQGAPANLDLVRRTTRADFYAQIGVAEQQALYPQIAMNMSSDSDQETYAFFGAISKPVRTDVRSGAAGSGVNRDTPFKDYAMSLKNATWRWTQRVNRDIVEDAKLDQIRVRAQSGADSGVSFQDERMVAVIEANGNSYDGVAFFAATHHGGSGAAKDNDLTSADDAGLNVAVTSNPTTTESENIISAVLQRARTTTDDQARIANTGDLGIVWFVPPGWERGFRSVVEIGPVAGQAGNTGVFKGFGKVVVNPYGSNSAIGYAFITAKPIRPIVYQTRIPWEFKMIMEGDDWELRDLATMKGRARFDYLLGDWKKAYRITLD